MRKCPMLSMYRRHRASAHLLRKSLRPRDTARAGARDLGCPWLCRSRVRGVEKRRWNTISTSRLFYFISAVREKTPCGRELQSNQDFLLFADKSQRSAIPVLVNGDSSVQCFLAQARLRWSNERLLLTLVVETLQAKQYRESSSLVGYLNGHASSKRFERSSRCQTQAWEPSMPICTHVVPTRSTSLLAADGKEQILGTARLILPIARI